MSGIASVVEREPAVHGDVAGGGEPPVLRGPEVPIERLHQALRTVRRLCPALPVTAIRWMHLKHPFHQMQEALLRGDGWLEWLQATGPSRADLGRWAVRRGSRSALAKRLAQSVVYALVLVWRLASVRVLLHREAAALKRRRFDLVLKTCCFGPDRPLGDQDFYFGDLQQRLARRGLRTLLLCGDVRGGDLAVFVRAHVSTGEPARLPELCLVHPLTPLRVLAQQLRACLRLRRVAARAAGPLIKRISLLASQDCLAPDTAWASLFYYIGRQAVRTWRPRAFVTPYEGHAWELCVRWGAKTADAACLAVGYQHTAVFRESLALLAPAGEGKRVRTAPDVVLGLGERTLDLMRAGHARYRTRLLRFGSFRFQSRAVLGPAPALRRTVLVAPEGIASEMQLLFTFALACARRLPSHTFVLRCHPEVPMARALQLVGADLARQPNMVLSDRPIEEDFARADALLYRGSSAVLYAVLAGLLPIYVPVDGMRDRDPLFALEAWRKRGATADAVAEILACHQRTPSDVAEAAWAAAARYVQAYTGPVDDQGIDALLESTGLKSARHFVEPERARGSAWH